MGLRIKDGKAEELISALDKYLPFRNTYKPGARHRRPPSKSRNVHWAAVTLNLDCFTDDSILTYGSMAVIPVLAISSVQSQKIEFEYINSLNKCLDCGYFHIVWNYLCCTIYFSTAHKLFMAIYASFSRKMLKTRSSLYLLWWEMNFIVE